MDKLYPEGGALEYATQPRHPPFYLSTADLMEEKLEKLASKTFHKGLFTNDKQQSQVMLYFLPHTHCLLKEEDLLYRRSSRCMLPGLQDR